MAHYLEDIGKKVFILNADPVPAFLEFLTRNFYVDQFQAQKHNRIIESCDGCIVVDVSEWKRLGDIAGTLKKMAIPLVCIDHHLSAGKIGDIHIIDDQASSTGELVYDFLKTADARFTQTVVDAIYTCILTDTGSFKFSNTTSKTHVITADLIAKGAQFQKIYAELYESDSIARSLLKGHLLANMQFECDGRFAWFVMSQELLQSLGAKTWEAEGFSDLPRAIKGVEISIMFSEHKDGSSNASFRSKGTVTINQLAEQFGGGGHKYAAGASLPWPLSKAVQIVVEAAKSYLNHLQEREI